MRSNNQHFEFNAFDSDRYGLSPHTHAHELQQRTPSVVSARRGRSHQAAPSGGAASSSFDAPPVASGEEQYGEALDDKQIEDRLQPLVERLSGQISTLDKKLVTISDSVQFTEAYVSVEMVSRIVAAMEERMAAGDIQIVRRVGMYRRFRALFLTVVFGLLVACLVGEIRNDWVSNALDARFPF